MEKTFIVERPDTTTFKIKGARLFRRETYSAIMDRDGEVIIASFPENYAVYEETSLVE